MSDHEFENYLALLAKLLRLDTKQRDAIAGELRDHLEQRLDELLARGVPRHEAVRLALEDFGDAAGLAAQFVSISRNRRRRWLMRVTTFSVAAMVLLAAGIAIFWPGRNAGPGVAALVAQDPEPEKKPAEADPFDGEEKPAKAPEAQPQPLEVKLNKLIDVEFVQISLKDALDFMEGLSDIQFYVERKKLEEAGLSEEDATVTKELKQVRVATLLDLMLGELELTYYEKDNLIVITTPEDAESTLEIRVYDCRDLLGLPGPAGRPAVARDRGGFFGGGGAQPAAAADPTRLPQAEILPQFGGAGGAPPAAEQKTPDGGTVRLGGGAGAAKPRSDEEEDADALISLITTNVDPDQWDEVGGPGSISTYHGLIVVTQTAQIHKKVERVLDMLREAAGLEVGMSKKVVR